MAAEFGYIFPQTEIGTDLGLIRRLVAAVEEAGFSFLVMYDHVLGADTTTRPDWTGVYTSRDQFHEPFVLMSYLASVTTLNFATGVLVLPQRQTALVAKQAAEVDILTGGRLRLGVGTGWNQVEYEALGVDFEGRGARYEEQLDVLRLLWTSDTVEFNGRFHVIDRAGILPLPIQRPIPLWLGGGRTNRALRRIGRLADGWMPPRTLGPDRDIEPAIEKVGVAAAAAGRDPADIGMQAFVEIVKYRHEALREQVDAWNRLGASHIALSPFNMNLSPAEHIELVRELGRTVDIDQVRRQA